MNWQEILTLLIPIFALMGWTYKRIDKRFESADKRFESIDKRFDKLFDELKEMRKEIQSLDSRIARIEGHLTGMGYHWESKVVEKREEK